jgi:hypothetical protein
MPIAVIVWTLLTSRVMVVVAAVAVGVVHQAGGVAVVVRAEDAMTYA